MKKLKKQNAITLVALIITIIILLILAGISISALTNQGLFTQAQNAKNLTEEKTAEENEILTNYLEQMNAIIGGQVTESIPDGAVVTPINDITTWLKTAGITRQYSYTTIEQVIADSTCTESLMNNKNAMKYLTRSTEFADAICASETTMTALGQSAYIDDTVLNSNTWIIKISSSNYWDLIYPSVTVHSSASATITVAGKTFTSDATGNTTHSIPWGTFNVSDSVSGQSFECTIGKDTTDVYVMPEGALYWYGNECIDKTGGWVSTDIKQSYKTTNNLILTRGVDSSGSAHGGYNHFTINSVLNIRHDKIKFISKATGSPSNSLQYVNILYDDDTIAWRVNYAYPTQTFTINSAKNVKTLHTGVGFVFYIYAIWLE